MTESILIINKEQLKLFQFMKSCTGYQHLCRLFYIRSIDLRLSEGTKGVAKNIKKV